LISGKTLFTYRRVSMFKFCLFTPINCFFFVSTKKKNVSNVNKKKNAAWKKSNSDKLNLRRFENLKNRRDWTTSVREKKKKRVLKKKKKHALGRKKKKGNSSNRSPFCDLIHGCNSNSCSITATLVQTFLY